MRPVLRLLAVPVLLLAGACSPRAAAPAAAPSAVPSPVSSPSPSLTPSSAAPDCVGRILGGMSVPEQAGQVLMIGTPVAAPREITGDLTRLHLGGVFLAGRSTRSATALRADIAALTRSGGAVPPLVSLDQEGGSVQTLKGDDFPILPSAQRLGARSATELRDTVSGSARRLAAIGITLNLAPVADTVPADIAEANPPIGAFRRQYGSQPAKVAAAIRTAVPASQDAGVLTVLKHFPGLGRVRANTDVTADVIDAHTTADDPYLEPFRAGIEAGSAAVMMSSARYPRLDQETIAAYSEPIITGLLREKLGFRGLVMSDDLGAADAAAIAPVGERAVRFIAAGGDLALTIRPEDAKPMAEALTERAGKDEDFALRLKDAASHVLRVKDRAGLLSCG
ncbi:glycoside hydrolase family 3 N-terminal domain-containing protein [Actinoplanes sp. RD1]|uniref:glycoside hydrolase family 3 N-terminal domain-containing protein n=1 Tax=Actinoplanes sp. RD1 TaxID=3064538 RepID=UPI0027403A28|nr:glycoside hydrolase family 3 N-terminal domain-containing protein [Actinoplanes sp. RD1]